MTETPNNKRSKRIATNTVVLFARMLIITCINLFTVRWVLNGLGTEDYGIFNAVAGIVTASTCISSVLALSTQRFYSYSIGKGEREKLKDIFSASLNIVIVLVLVIIIVFEVIGPWFVSTQLTIPSNRMSAALWVLQFSLFSFIFTLIQIPFIGAVFSNENMDIYALVSTIDCFIKLIIAYLICHTKGDNLVFYGFALMVEAFVVMLFYIIISRKKYEECRYKWVNNKTLYKQLGSFSGWTFYGALSSMGMAQGSVILLNIFFGPIVNAAFNIANQMYNAINTLANSLIIAIRPAMIKTYSSNNNEYLSKLFYTSNKILLYLLTSIGIPLVYETKTILQLWLGTYTSDMISFCRLYIIFTILLSLHNPITTIIQASGNVKKYSMLVESLTILNIPISWFCYKLSFPAFTIFIVMIGLCICAHIVRLHILQQNCSFFSYKEYFTNFIIRGLIIIATNILITNVIYKMVKFTYIRFMATFVISLIVTICLVYIIELTKEEKKVILTKIKK